MQLAFLPAAVLPVIIGFKSNLRREFFKSILHGYVLVLIFSASSCVLGPVLMGRGFGDIGFMIAVVFYFFWVLLILAVLIGIVLFFVRKLKSRRHVRLGYGIVIVLFGVGFHICHYVIAQEIAWAIAAAAMMR